jgi:RNA polymerase-interacting CarD/CdnL/TRCF family regulator
MFQIGEHVVHPGQGVCTVVGFKDAPSPMIELEAHSGHAKTKLLYPVAQADRLHLCIGKDQAEELLSDYDAIECDSFTERNSSLEETYFKQLIKEGAPATIRVAKTMRARISDAEARGKKPSSYYTRILKEAHRRSVEELAVALDVSEDDVEERMQAGIASFGAN